MKRFESLLEGWTQFIEQRRLTGKYCVTTTGWSLDHAKKSVRWWIDFIRMISVVLSREIAMSSDIPENMSRIDFEGEVGQKKLTRHAQ